MEQHPNKPIYDLVDEIIYWCVVVSSVIILFFVMTGCSAQWHVKRAVLKDPSILDYKEVRLDTVIVTKPVQMTDTFTLREYDTIVNRVNGIEYKIIRRVDTFNLDIKCPPDTVRIEVVKNVPQIKYQPLSWYNRPGIWIMFIVIAAVAWFIFKIANTRI